MPRKPHAAHRFRIASRCVVCGVRLLGACSYRTCAETLIYRAGCPHYRPRRNAPTRRVDLVAEARAIFGDMLADHLPLGE